jgi:hypothetical protein
MSTTQISNYVIPFTAFAIVFVFIAWGSLQHPAAGDDLKTEAFSPIGQTATFGDIANKCMALTGDSQRGAKTDAEEVRLADQGTTCLSFITGFLDGYIAAQMAASDKRAAFCIPPAVTTAQIVKAFLTAAYGHPQLSQENGTEALQAVLVNAYPCKEMNVFVEKQPSPASGFSYESTSPDGKTRKNVVH